MSINIFVSIGLTSDGNCEVQYDKDDEPFEISMHETTPLSNDTTDSSDSESDKDEEMEAKTGEHIVNLYESEELIKMSATESLGDWEKYTKVKK